MFLLLVWTVCVCVCFVSGRLSVFKRDHLGGVQKIVLHNVTLP